MRPRFRRSGSVVPGEPGFSSRGFQYRKMFFTLLPLNPCPHGCSSFAVGFVSFGQGLLLPYYPGVIPGVYLLPPMHTAIISKAVLPFHHFLIRPSFPFWPLGVVVVCASRFLAPHRRRFPIPYLSLVLFFSYLVFWETNFLLASLLSAPGTRRHSMMPSLALGVARPSWPFVVLWSPPSRSMVG